MKKIVRIIDRLNIGGPAKHVTWLAAGLDPGEFETTLIAGTVPEGEGDMGYFARAAGVEPLVIKEMSRELSPADLIVVFKLLRILFRLRPQIVHTHKAKAGAVGRVAATIYKMLGGDCLIVHTYHGHIFHSYYGSAKTRLFIMIEQMLARFCTDRIVTISEQQRSEISQTFKVGRPDQFVVIPLGIDLGDSPAPELKLKHDAVLIGITGRLCEVKNHSLFLQAAARIDDAQFVIIGDGHLREDLESQAESLGLQGRISFTGFRDDVLSLYPQLDIAALTSLNEGTPLTLIEAMSCGLPVASTEVGGVVDLMGAKREAIDGLTIWDHGVTSPSGDVEGFARALNYLIERPQLRTEMGARGREFVRSQLSRERLIRDIETLYGK